MTDITKICLSTVFILLLLVSASASAWEDEREEAMSLKADLNNGKAIYYNNCVTCHHETGWADGSDISRQQEPGYFPQIAGQHNNVIIKQMADIRAGNRDNPMMYPFTLDKYVNGTQGIADVSAYVAGLKPSENNNIGAGNDLEHGEYLYKHNCVKCHGDYGEGSDEFFYPKIQGQHYNYLLRQFIWIRDGKRRNANKKMMGQIERFSYRDMKAVIDYVSRLKPAPENHESKIEKE